MPGAILLGSPVAAAAVGTVGLAHVHAQRRAGEVNGVLVELVLDAEGEGLRSPCGA